MTIAIFAFLASSVFAAPPKSAQFDPPKKEIKFTDGDEVVGELNRGDGSDVSVGPAKKFASLVKPRLSFVPELVDSARR